MSLIFQSRRVSFYCLCRMCALVHDLFSVFFFFQFLPKLVTHIPWFERVQPCIKRLSLVLLGIVLLAIYLHGTMLSLFLVLKAGNGEGPYGM